MSRPILIVAVLLLTLSILSTGAQAQVTREKPVMENTFFNVVWGSATGGVLGAASAALGGGTATSPKSLRENAITGATVGGIIGLGIGVWLTFNGVTFDPDRSLLFGSVTPELREGVVVETFTPPLVIETEPGKPFHITGVKALVFFLKF